VAVEPPASVMRQAELFEELRSTVDPARQRELMNEIIQIASEEFYVFGTILAPDEVGLISNNFHNVFPPGAETERMFSAYNWPQPAPLMPEQFFIRN
jgi:peptide/nickel transport system substrate-binding protein